MRLTKKDLDFSRDQDHRLPVSLGRLEACDTPKLIGSKRRARGAGTVACQSPKTVYARHSSPRALLSDLHPPCCRHYGSGASAPMGDLRKSFEAVAMDYVQYQATRNRDVRTPAHQIRVLGEPHLDRPLAVPRLPRPRGGVPRGDHQRGPRGWHRDLHLPSVVSGLRQSQPEGRPGREAPRILALAGASSRVVVQKLRDAAAVYRAGQRGVARALHSFSPGAAFQPTAENGWQLTVTVKPDRGERQCRAPHSFSETACARRRERVPDSRASGVAGGPRRYHLHAAVCPSGIPIRALHSSFTGKGTPSSPAERNRDRLSKHPAGSPPLPYGPLSAADGPRAGGLRGLHD